MIRNTEPHTWRGVWYMPVSDERHHGVLDYKPDQGFQLTIMTEGFESPWVREQALSKRFQPPSEVSVIKLRDVSSPYPAIYGEADGRLITLFDVYDGGFSQKEFGQAPFATAKYHPQMMLIGAHVADKGAPNFRSLSVSIDYLHYWLYGTGWLQVGMSRNEKYGAYSSEYFTKVETRVNDRPREGVTLDDGTAFTIGYYGTLPGLKWSACEFESRSSISAAIEVSITNGLRSLDSFQDVIFTLENLISICLDRRCRTFALKAELWENGKREWVDIVMPRQGAVPSQRASGEHLYGLATCKDSGHFNQFLERWFTFYGAHSAAVSMLNAFLEVEGVRFLEQSVMMAQTLLEAFHKSVYGNRIDDLLEASTEAAEVLRPSNTEYEKSRLTTFKRAIDLYFRMPVEIRETLIPNKELWIRNLTVARNDIIHEGGLKKTEPRQANAAAQVSVAVVTIHVLIQLGVESSTILDSLNRSTSLMKAKEQARKYLS